MSLDGTICTTVSGIFQHTAQNNLFWVTNWKIQQTGLVEDTWVEGTRGFGNWWWWTEGKTRKKEVIWREIFKKFRSQLSTPEGRKELDLPLFWGSREGAATAWWAVEQSKKTNHNGGTGMTTGTSSSVLGEMGSREFLQIQTQHKDLSIKLWPLCTWAENTTENGELFFPFHELWHWQTCSVVTIRWLPGCDFCPKCSLDSLSL